MPAEYAAEDLAAGRAALLSGWSAGTEPSLVIARSSGALVWAENGREYIDCTSMAWSNNLGGSRPEVVEAAFAQARELSHLRSNFDSVPLLLLSRAMTRAAPGDLKRIGFTLHGSLAVEMAMKLALINRPASTGPFLALADAYHGRSLASMGLGWPHTNHAFDRMFPAVLRVPQPYAYRSGRSPEAEVDYCVGELRDAIERRATGRPPAFIMEPVQGNGTQLDFPERYYREVRQVCDEYGILLIFDEVQTGFGRTGRMWAAEHYGVTPDLLVFGKGVGGGFPLAGVLASSALDGFQPGDDALTFGEFPVSLAAGLAALEVLERDHLLQACTELGKYATDGLLEMQPRHLLIGDVRGPGLLIGIELVRDRQTREPAAAEAAEVERRARDLGVLFGTTRYAGLGNVLKIKPPFTITTTHLDRVLDVLDQVLTVIENRRS
ncbi:MAG TPA: aminotransferase class III-fold pyridoxal phosphate-dependent enzyme [Streptosporangiaceae bacterium]|nr:aminotransferase class III-fold pyridoxal phosphate-dependent enzyme [Streptosporangiaceae bacterium]